MHPTSTWSCRLCGSTGLSIASVHYCPNCGHERDYDTPSSSQEAAAPGLRFQGEAFRCCGVGYGREASFCVRCGSSLLAAPPMLWDGPPSAEDQTTWDLWVERSLEGADPLLIDGVTVEDRSQDGEVEMVLCMDDHGRVMDEQAQLTT